MPRLDIGYFSSAREGTASVVIKLINIIDFTILFFIDSQIVITVNS